jgi:hypothetical protein
MVISYEFLNVIYFILLYVMNITPSRTRRDGPWVLPSLL